jgi:hypothetical protein
MIPLTIQSKEHKNLLHLPLQYIPLRRSEIRRWGEEKREEAF